MKNLAKYLLLAVLTLACCLMMVSCSEEEVHTCNEYMYRWKNIDGVNTYQKVCKDCGKAENLNPSKALLLEGDSFATTVYLATGYSTYAICTIEFKANCTKPEDFGHKMVVSDSTSEYDAWIDWNSETKTVTIMTDADVFKLNENSERMFDNDHLHANYSLEEIKFNHLLDTSAVTSFKHFFNDCCSLRSVDLSDFDTSNVTTMKSMFDHCQSLEALDLSGFDTSNVTDMEGMFNFCRKLEELDLNGFVTSNVSDFFEMFSNCYLMRDLKLGNGFSLESAEYSSSMFHYLFRYVGDSMDSGDSIDVITGISETQINSLMGVFDDFIAERCKWTKSGDKIILTKNY